MPGASHSSRRSQRATEPARASASQARATASQAGEDHRDCDGWPRLTPLTAPAVAIVTRAAAARAMTRLPLGTDIAALVRELIVEHFGLAPGAADDDAKRFADIDGADNLDLIELAMVVEDAFAITITDAEVDATPTIGALIALVTRKVSEK